MEKGISSFRKGDLRVGNVKFEMGNLRFGVFFFFNLRCSQKTSQTEIDEGTEKKENGFTLTTESLSSRQELPASDRVGIGHLETMALGCTLEDLAWHQRLVRWKRFRSLRFMVKKLPCRWLIRIV